jgi:hypothetical protein
METLTGYTVNELSTLDLKTIPTGSFRISSTKKSKTIEFFDDLYTYPPQFRVKWDTIDELNDDLFMSYNYRTIDDSLPFVNVLNDFFQKDENETIEKTKYSLRSYINGYFNKITSERFYTNKTRNLQTALSNVPVYVILNGQKEIVLATSTNSLSSKSQSLQSTAYEFCGEFDSLVENNPKLGLFFMSRRDAEIYLNEIARLDTQGTKMFGLSVHCFGLDFAYRVTREAHPNIDFRFIPDLNEVQELMTTQSTGDSNLIFDDSQQQLRFRRRSINIIPIFNNLNKWVSPFSSFIEKTEYFKGVPIYLVKTNEKPTKFLVKRYQNVVNLVDSVFGRVIKYVDLGIGFGNNWILQGSLQDQKTDGNTTTYVFFERKAALDFCKQNDANINRYNGSRSSFLQPLIKKPKIFVNNLEDFLENCEEAITEVKFDKDLNFNPKSLKIIPSKQAMEDIENYLTQTKKSPLKTVSEFLDFKARRLTGFMETLSNTN